MALKQLSREEQLFWKVLWEFGSYKGNLDGITWESHWIRPSSDYRSWPDTLALEESTVLVLHQPISMSVLIIVLSPQTFENILK